MAEQADLLGAVRLPADSFGKSANTAVTSDLLFFQKKAEPSIGEPIWTYTGLTEDMVPVNEYYLEHPEMMLGKMVWFEQFFGKDSKYTALVNEAEDFDLEKRILDAVGELPKNCYEESVYGDTGRSILPGRGVFIPESGKGKCEAPDTCHA